MDAEAIVVKGHDYFCRHFPLLHEKRQHIIGFNAFGHFYFLRFHPLVRPCQSPAMLLLYGA